MRGKLDPALVIIVAGISAALHIGKLPPALPVLREAFHLSLVQAGFLLSLVQFAGMTLGLAIGAAGDSIGPRRTMVLGLVILSGASFAGGAAHGVALLMALRAIEGVGFLLAVLPAPGLIRSLVEPKRLSAMLGVWSTFMPFGTATALLVGPACIAVAGWPGWWWLLAALSLLMAVVVWLVVPPAANARGPRAPGEAGRVARTLRAKGALLAAFAFAAYSFQWLAVVGFLPTIYAQSGLPTAYAAVATALAAAVNIIGNVASGRLLQRGVPAPILLHAGHVAMLLGAMVAFAGWTDVALLRYAGVLLFSMVGGLIPGTLFSLGVRVAPDESTVSTTVGWMMQLSALGQFAGPPIAAWAAARAGGWHAIWWVTGTMAVVGMVIAQAISRFLVGHPQRAAALQQSRP